MRKFSIFNFQFSIKLQFLNSKPRKVCKLVIGNWNFQSAYTLIEILVGLTIVGLLFSFGYVSFRDFSRREALAGSIKKIQGDLRLAQQEALSGEKPDDLKCNPPNTLDTIRFNVVSTSDYRLEADCSGGVVIIKEVTLPTDVSLSTPSPNPIKFKVLAHGTNIVDAEIATLVLTQAGTANTSTITVTAGGEIK